MVGTTERGDEGDGDVGTGLGGGNGIGRWEGNWDVGRGLGCGKGIGMWEGDWDVGRGLGGMGSGKGRTKKLNLHQNQQTKMLGQITACIVQLITFKV